MKKQDIPEQSPVEHLRIFVELYRLIAIEGRSATSLHQGAEKVMSRSDFEKCQQSIAISLGIERERDVWGDRRSKDLYEKASRIVAELDAICQELRTDSNRVVILGGEFSLSWIMPHALGFSPDGEKCLLQTHPELTYDLRRQPFPLSVESLVTGRSDIIIGPNISRIPEGIRREKLCAIPRCLMVGTQVYDEVHEETLRRFNLGMKESCELRLPYFKRYPFLAIRQEAAPDFNLDTYIKTHVKGAKLWYVDSTAYMYEYVRLGVAVGLGFNLFGYPLYKHPKDIVKVNLPGTLESSFYVYGRVEKHPPQPEDHVFDALTRFGSFLDSCMHPAY